MTAEMYDARCGNCNHRGYVRLRLHPTGRRDLDRVLVPCPRCRSFAVAYRLDPVEGENP